MENTHWAGLCQGCLVERRQRPRCRGSQSGREAWAQGREQGENSFVAFSAGMGSTWLGKAKTAGSGPDHSFSPTGLAVGLDPEGYGNPDFCWISIHDKLVWSFAGPITVVIVVKPCPVSPRALSCLPSPHHGHSPVPWLPTACPVLCAPLPVRIPLCPSLLQPNPGETVAWA